MELLSKLSRTQVLAIISTSILVLSLGSYGVLIFEEDKIQEKLEQAEFVVTRFDIIGGTPQALLARGEAQVNFDGELASGASIDSFKVRIYNGSVELAEVEIPAGEFSSSTVIPFEISIPVDDSNPSPLTADVLVYIMTGKNFFVNFSATVEYTIGILHRSLDFENILQFRLDQPVLELSLQELIFPENPVDQFASIVFELYNPFSLDVSMEGNISVNINHEAIGLIDLQYQEFTPMHNLVNESLKLFMPVADVYSRYFEYITQPIVLATDLEIGFGQLIVDISPDLQLTSKGLDLGFNITSIDGLIIDPIAGTISGTLSGIIKSGLPVTLNISSIAGHIYNAENLVGNFSWVSNESVLLISNHFTKLNGININSTADKAHLFITLSSNIVLNELSISIYIQGELRWYQIYL